MRFNEMTDAQIRAQVEPLALEVGKRLDGDWRLAHDENIVGAHIVSGDMRLCFYYISREDRIRISGKYPRTREVSVSDENKSPEITVSPRRNPGQIAGDISRKLLPGYTEGLRRHLAALAKRDADEAGSRMVTDQIASILGTSSAGSSVGLPYGLRGSVGVSNGGKDVTMSLYYLPADLAVKIARLIAQERG